MIEQVAVGGFDNNFSYIVHDNEKAAIVDPSGDIEKAFSVLHERKLELVGALITHTHFDHHDKLAVVIEQFPHVSVYVHKNGKHTFSVDDGIVYPVADGEIIAVGSLEIKVMHTPGHINDAVCYHLEKEKILITGDTLFVEGCGRVGSEKDASVLYESLEKLKQLPDETRVFPGHDYGSKPYSTIGYEKAHNRFLLAKNLEAFIKERLG